LSALRARVISGTTAAAVVLAALAADAWWAGRAAGSVVAAVVLVLVLLATDEVVAMARAKGYQPRRGVALLCGAGLAVMPLVQRHAPGSAAFGPLLWLAAALGAALWQQARHQRTTQAAANVGLTLLAIVYVGGLASFLLRLRLLVDGPGGVALLLYSVFLVKINDIGAFFTGRTWGRHKLIPWLSPAKTWEGLAGGLVTTVACGLAGGWALYAGGLSPAGSAPAGWLGLCAGFGLLMGLVSVAGDLAASLLKRDAEVKDSSTLIPGLGGVLDVLDSPLLAAPLAWAFWYTVLTG